MISLVLLKIMKYMFSDNSCPEFRTTVAGKNIMENMLNLSQILPITKQTYCLFQLLLFAEGTRFTEAKHKASMEVARKKGIPELKHHLLPRTKGFVLTMTGVKGKSK